MNINFLLHKDLHNPQHKYYRKGQTCAWGMIFLSTLLFPYIFYLLTLYNQSTAKNFFALYGALVAWASLVSLKFTPNVNAILGVMLTVVLFTTAMAVNHTGGIYSVGLLWYFCIVVCAFLFLGINWGIFIAILSYGIIGYLYFLETNDAAPHFRVFILSQKTPFHNLFTNYFLLLLVIVLLISFVKILNKANLKIDELSKEKIQILELKVNEKTSEISNLRSSLAKDFHDEMGSHLTSISILAQSIGIKALQNPNDEEIAIMLKTIENRAKDLYNGTKDFIWSVDFKSDNVNEFYIYLRDFGEVFFNEIEIDFISENKVDSNNISTLPATTGRQLLFICKEIMTNAAKHSKANTISFITYIENNQFVIEISDNGKGFDSEKVKKRGLNNINKRASDFKINLNFKSDHLGVKYLLKTPTFFEIPTQNG